MTVNLPLLITLARRLRPVLDELVFVGGATVELYQTDPAAARPRVTRDVDVVCEAESRTAYFELGERLRALGFTEDQSEGAPIGRWRSLDGILDLMPEDPAILGFTNPWYDLGIKTAERRSLTGDLIVRILQPPVFVATKLSAYEGRGAGDPFSSHDVEDLVVVASGRPELPEEVAAAGPELRGWTARFLRTHFAGDLREMVAANLPQARETPGLVSEVVRRFEAMMSHD